VEEHYALVGLTSVAICSNQVEVSFLPLSIHSGGPSKHKIFVNFDFLDSHHSQQQSKLLPFRVILSSETLPADSVSSRAE